MSAGRAPTLAYLVSQYPAVSHTFILREIEELRRLGFTVRTASVKPAAPSPSGFTEAEAAEAAATFCVKKRSPWRIVGDHAAAFVRRPHAYLSGLLLAFRLAGPDLKAIAYHLLYFAEAAPVGEWMRRNGLRRLHVHFANAASTVALLVKTTHGAPYSMTVHGPDEFYDTGFYHLREKIEASSFICCISQFCRSQLMKSSSPEHWGKMEVCPLGVDPAKFRPSPEWGGTPGLPPGRQAPLTPSGDVFRILCVGRLTPAKGQAILLAAVGRLVRSGRRVHADFAGDGPDRAALEREAARTGVSGHVSFHGAVNQKRVLELLAQTDAFVLPSFAEGVPVSLMEAMAMEIPCISTTIAGIPELIESGEEGLLVPPSAPDLLAAAIEKLIDDPALRLRLAQAGRRKVIESYNLPVNVERLAAIFSRRLAAEAQTAAAHAAGQP